MIQLVCGQNTTREFTVLPSYAQWSLYVPHSGHYIYRQFNIQQFYILPTQCVYVLCVDLRKNSDYFPIQHQLTGFYNREGVFTARYGLSV